MKPRHINFRVLSLAGVTAALIGISAVPIKAADLTVTGDLDVNGNNFDFGTTASNQSAVLMAYSATSLTTRFDATPNSAIFVWRDAAGTTGGAQLKLKLDGSNVLTLYNSGGDPRVVFTPNSGQVLYNTSGVATISLTPNNGQINLVGSGSGIYANGAAVFTVNSSGNVVFADRSSNFSNNTPSTSSTTGALTVSGGLGVATDSFINGIRIGRAGGNNVTNLALGYSGLNSNTSGTSNTATGYGVLTANTSGSCNTGSGRSALELNTSGSHNSAVGFAGLWNNTTGSYNVALGDDAGRYLVSGQPLSDPENSIYIGANARGLSNSDDNAIVIGRSALGEGANTTVIGTSATTKTHLYGQTVTSSLTVSGPGALNSLSVSGATVLSGSVVVAAPQGDISMGVYGN